MTTGGSVPLRRSRMSAVSRAPPPENLPRSKSAPRTGFFFGPFSGDSSPSCRKICTRGALNAVGCLPARGDPGVAEYRAYVVGHDGHFIRFESLICADDDEAIAQAKRLVADHDVELWSGKRFVIRLEVTTK